MHIDTIGMGILEFRVMKEPAFGKLLGGGEGVLGPTLGMMYLQRKSAFFIGQ